MFASAVTATPTVAEDSTEDLEEAELRALFCDDSEDYVDWLCSATRSDILRELCRVRNRLWEAQSKDQFSQAQIKSDLVRNKHICRLTYDNWWQRVYESS